MKKQFNLARVVAFTAVAVGALMYACQDPGADEARSSAAAPKPVVAIGTATTECDVTNITTDLHLVSSNNYRLFGDVRITGGATLTIDPGTVIFGDEASRGTLTITRGSQIFAVGNKNQPIVFTSGAAPGERRPKDWGGINIMGNGINNLGVNLTPEGYPVCVTAPLHGGTSCDESSGIISYVRIEYGGIPIADTVTFPNSEKNGLTLYSVGSGTTLDHIQVSYGGDDGFEFFGGCVNAKYLFSLGMVDDDFDTDNGYSGCVQYAASVRHPFIADISQSNGFESDNNATGTGALPKTSATFSNVTLIGPFDTESPSRRGNVINNPSPGKRYGDGLHLRRNTNLKVHNALVVGWKLREAFIASGITAVELTNNTGVVPNGVAGAICFAEAGSNLPWTTGAANVCATATAYGDEFTTGSLAELSGLSIAAWPNVLQIDSDPGEIYYEFDTFFADDLRPLAGTFTATEGVEASTVSACTAFFSLTPNETGDGENFFRGAFRDSENNGITPDGWDTDGTWLQMNPQFEPYEN